MTFPFSVRFNRKLKAVITPGNQQQVLQYITKRIADDKADNIVAEDRSVRYKGSTANWNTSLFKTVDDGVFTLTDNDGSWWLNYQVNMQRLFIYPAIISAMAEVFSLAIGRLWWIGLFFFLALCGGNWVINLLLHGTEATDISEGIDELICGKPPLPENEERDERLKSWF